jgi:hypothetical protein
MTEISKELKEKIFAAFEAGTSPVQAVIDFKVVPEVIAALFKQYVESKGAGLIEGSTVRKVEKALGRKLESSEAFLKGVLELRQLVNEVYSEVAKAMGDTYTPPEETLKTIADMVQDVDLQEAKQVLETLKTLGILSRRGKWHKPVEPVN